jgi:hypothetical protein
MATELTNERKRKSTDAPKDVVSNNDEGLNERKTRRVSDGISIHADTAASTEGLISGDGCDGGDQESLQSGEHNAGREESLQNIGKLVQDLFLYGQPARVIRAALDALRVQLNGGPRKCEDFVTVGGCAALVQLLRAASSLKPAQPLSTEFFHELPEWNTLYKALRLVTLLMGTHLESSVAMTAIGGVETIVNVMKTFRNCKAVTALACFAIRKLALCKIGKNAAVEAGAMQVLLLAIHDHLACKQTCEYALYALVNIVRDSKENTKLLISLGGAAAVVKVKSKWQDGTDVYPPLRQLAQLLAEELDRWDDSP